MKKLILFLILFSLPAFLLAGCASQLVQRVNPDKESARAFFAIHYKTPSIAVMSEKAGKDESAALAGMYPLLSLIKKSNKIKHFGYTYTQLRQLVFNITDTKYFSAIQSSAASICGMSGNSSEMLKADGEIVANTDSFMSVTNNAGALYGMVNSYYSNALTAKYGTLKTSFLKVVGIPANLEITYNTILRNSNVFLSIIPRNAMQTSRFDVVFNTDFVNWTESSRNICMVGRYAPQVDTLEHFYTPHLNTINFYSLVYYLLHNIYYPVSAGNKQFSEKLFADIVMARWKHAVKLYAEIYPTVQNAGAQTGSYNIATFKKLIAAGKLKRAAAFLSAYKYPTHFMSRYFYNTTTDSNLAALKKENAKAKIAFRKAKLNLLIAEAILSAAVKQAIAEHKYKAAAQHWIRLAYVRKCIRNNTSLDNNKIGYYECEERHFKYKVLNPYQHTIGGGYIKEKPCELTTNRIGRFTYSSNSAVDEMINSEFMHTFFNPKIERNILSVRSFLY